MGRDKAHIPIRTCISCGKKRNKNELLRLALNRNGQIVKDEYGKMQGRGAYVCKMKGCQELLLRNKRIHRIFRMKRAIDASQDLILDFKQRNKEKKEFGGLNG